MTEPPTTVDSEITATLGRAAALFGGQYTLLVRTCHAHGLTGALGLHLCRVYLDARHIRDPRIIESLLSIAMHHCENQYCYVVHSAWLLGHEVSIDQVTGVLDLLEVPDGITEREKWSMVLRCTYFAFLDNHTYQSNARVVRERLDPEEYRDYVHILTLAGFLRTVLTCFADEIDLQREPLLAGAQAPLTQKLLANSEFHLARRSSTSAEGDSQHLVTLCMFCKDLRTEDETWVPIEACIGQLTTQTAFSHGVCPRCFEREFGELPP